MVQQNSFFRRTKVSDLFGAYIQLVNGNSSLVTINILFNILYFILSGWIVEKCNKL